MADRIPVSDPFNFPAPQTNEIEKELIRWATYYNVYQAKAADEGEPLLDISGNPLGPKVSTFDWCKAAVEATIRIEDKDGRMTVYNYAAKPRQVQVDCSQITPNFPEGRIRWKLAKGPFGDGVNGMILVPFRTIAVPQNLAEIKYGTVIYIPAARGKNITLPSGAVVQHDGYFYAADTGDGINDLHIDVFGGIYDKNPFPGFIKSRPANTFEVYLIKNQQIADNMAQQHQG